MSPALFCDCTQRRMAVTHQILGQIIGAIFKDQAFLLVCLWEPHVVPKRRYRTTILLCIKSQRTQISLTSRRKPELTIVTHHHHSVVKTAIT
jgi:hypothetical protein